MAENTSIGRNSTAAAIGAMAAVLLTAAPVFAHTGRGTAGLWDGLAHPMLGIDHVFAMVTVGVLAAVMAKPLSAPAVFLAAMVAGGSLGLAGTTLPGGEVAIAASVAALGAALIAGRSMRAGMALGLIGLAGLAHGHAHGLEAPSAAHPVVYVAGFLAATAVLHLTGVTAGLLVRRHTAGRTALGALVLGAGAGLVTGLI